MEKINPAPPMPTGIVRCERCQTVKAIYAPFCFHNLCDGCFELFRIAEKHVFPAVERATAEMKANCNAMSCDNPSKKLAPTYPGVKLNARTFIALFPCDDQELQEGYAQYRKLLDDLAKPGTEKLSEP